MRILIACLDGELLWAIDDVISGLYSIDLETFETKCVIDCQKLFPYGRFVIQSLVKWKEDYILMIPLEVDKAWILYNKAAKEVEYRKITDKNYRGIPIIEGGNRNQLYFFPYYIQDPILIVNIDTLMCSHVIENWSGNIPTSCGETAWKGAYDGQYIFFPIKNTRLLVRMECETREIKLLELDVSENVIDVDCDSGELWVLPISGNQLYRVDENGRIINTVELLTKNTEAPLPGFARIIGQKRYLFLIPCYQKGIYIYDKLGGNTYIVPEEATALEKEEEIYLRYWGAYVRNNRIGFLPFHDQYLEIEMDTLAYQKQELAYPDMWSDEEKVERIIWSHVYEGDSVIKEMNECKLEIFLRHIRYRVNREKFTIVGYAGGEIWNILKNRKKPI